MTLWINKESSSPRASPTVMVPKADGTLSTDFQKVKAITVLDPFPLNHTEDLTGRIERAQFLTKLDITSGYWQVPLDDYVVPISALVMPFCHFQ